MASWAMGRRHGVGQAGGLAEARPGSVRAICGVCGMRAMHPGINATYSPVPM